MTADIQGQNKANPASLMLSATMLLEWLGRSHNNAALTKAGQKIEPLSMPRSRNLKRALPTSAANLVRKHSANTSRLYSADFNYNKWRNTAPVSANS